MVAVLEPAAEFWAWLRRVAARVLGRGVPALDRKFLAFIYIRGNGIEIGALHNPQTVPRSVHPVYVDRLRAEESARYEDLKGIPLHRVDVIDDAERLARFGDGSQDFVIANHVVEHLQDPIAGLEQMLRVLKPGGILFLAVPDKRLTFDRDRPITPLEHLVRDHEEGPAWHRRQHYQEWSVIVNKREEGRVVEEVNHLMNIDYSIHFHVWTQTELLELLLYMRKRVSFETEIFMKNGDEVVIVLRKSE